MATNGDVAYVVGHSNALAARMYAMLAADAADNLTFSPSSISMVFAMTFAGAAGETAREMSDVFGFTLPPDRLHTAFGELLASAKSDGVELRIANRLWGQRGYHFLPEFLKATESSYGAQLAELDFRGAARDAELQINAWIEERTAGRIKNLISPGTFDPLMRLVLTNAIYFLGSWEDEFDETATRPARFWTASDASYATAMMRQTNTCQYGESDGWQVLRMPYRREWRTIKPASEFAMYVVLPRERTGLMKMEARLPDVLKQALVGLRRCEVDIQLPKFRIEHELELSSALRSLGIRSAFSAIEADFSRMSDDPEGLFIGTVIHKAFVHVNEKGTEAAAATALAAVGSAYEKPEQRTFCADHPFMFLIRDETSKLIHFIGRVNSPERAF